MEKRIKALYIITILAILGFLGMQVYWLNSRYEYSLAQYEDAAQKEIQETLKSYRQERIKILDSVGGMFLNPSSYSVMRIPKADGKDFKVTRTRATERGFAQKLLGIKELRPLTQEEIDKVINYIDASDSIQEAMTVKATLHNPPSESAVLDALKNYDLENSIPFSTSKVETILKMKGYDAEVSSITTDSIEWQPTFRRHITAVSPTMEITAPYSEMESKSVRIIVHIPSSLVIAGMAGTLIIAGFVSLLLIACLIYQFTTIVRLDKLDKMRLQFVSTMIHELKRPVSTLKMCVSGLANEKMIDNPEMRSKLIGQTRRALDLMSSYFSKMRDLTFNKAKEIPLNCENLPLRSFFEECDGRISKPIGKSVEIVNRIPGEMEIYADRTHFMNIFTNLIENSIKYSGKAVKIIADARTHDSGGVSISIADNGNGIPTSDIDKVFAQFFRGSAIDSGIPGMGLGLAYVKMLIEAHGGKILVNSYTDGPERGTYFTIELPQ